MPCTASRVGLTSHLLTHTATFSPPKPDTTGSDLRGVTKCRLGRPHLSRPPPGPEPLGSPAPCPPRPPRTGCGGPGQDTSCPFSSNGTAIFMVTSSLLCPTHTGQTVPPAAAAAAVDLTPVTELIVPALDPAKTARPPGPPPVFPGGVIDGLHGAPGHLHIGAALLLRETLPVDQADGPHTHPPSGPQLPSGGCLPRGETPVSGASDRPFCTSWALARPSPSRFWSPFRSVKSSIEQFLVYVKNNSWHIPEIKCHGRPTAKAA